MATIATSIPSAHNRTESAYQIRGTDLGVSFPHRGRTYFLFGDTLRVDQPDDRDNLDLIAYTNETAPEDGLDLACCHEPPRISDGISPRGFEVPLDGVSAGRSMYVFFSTDARSYGDNELMGRSVLTRCNDGGFAFRYLRDISRDRLINVSVQRWRASTCTRHRPGGVAWTQRPLMLFDPLLPDLELDQDARRGADIYIVMSSWNRYQAHLMSAFTDPALLG